MKKKVRKNALDIFYRMAADMTSPIVLTAFFFAFVCLKLIPEPIKALQVFAVCFISQSVLPILYLLIAYKLKFIPDVHLFKKEDRNKAFPAIALFYLMGLLILYKISAPTIIIGLVFASTALLLVIWWVNVFYKISIHMSGFAGMLTGLFFVFGANSMPLVPLLPLSCWVRYRSKAHNFSELVTGALVGVIVTFLVLHFLFL